MQKATKSMLPITLRRSLKTRNKSLGPPGKSTTKRTSLNHTFGILHVQLKTFTCWNSFSSRSPLPSVSHSYRIKSVCFQSADIPISPTRRILASPCQPAWLPLSKTRQGIDGDPRWTKRLL